MSSLGFTGIAGGDIFPARFVKQDTANDFTILQAGANDPVFGIAQLGTNGPPIPGATFDKAAVAGGSIRLHKEGERCFVQAGGSITAGAYLKSDANGKAVVVAGGTAVEHVGARALQAASTNEFCEVEVTFQSYTAT